AFNATSCYTLRVQTGTASKNDVEVIEFVSNKLSVSPNPATNAVNLRFTADKSGHASISIMSQTGAAVISKTVTATAGDNLSKLDVSKLPNGMYFIKIQTGSVIQMAKLVIGK